MRFFQLVSIFMVLFMVNKADAADIQTIKIAYITQQKKVPAALSNLDTFIQQKGRLGAELAISDNNTTGMFTQQKFELQTIIAAVSADIVQVFEQQVEKDTDLIVSNLSVNQLEKIVGLTSAKTKLFFDASTRSDHLRLQCDNNLLHLLPSRAMRADALAQYMMKKRWNKWFLVTGVSKEDKLYAAAIKRSAKRFGIKIVKEKQWTHTYDARRTAQSDVPVFTQGIDYDVLVVADEQGLFGEYLDYRTWVPRPVIGTQGLVATAWHKTHEQWGAVQIQNRFMAKAGRAMEEEDYGAYLAVRSIGEAFIRTKSTQVEVIKHYLLSDKFALQGYKGKPLSFRSWNGQLRQPVLLAAARSLVAVSPIEGFLHPETDLDTLGYDEVELNCGKREGENRPLKATAKLDAVDIRTRFQRLIEQIKDKLKSFR